MVLDVSAALNQSRNRSLDSARPLSLNSCEATTCEINRDSAEFGQRQFAKTPSAAPNYRRVAGYTRCLPYSSLEEGQVSFPVAVREKQNRATAGL